MKKIKKLLILSFLPALLIFINPLDSQAQGLQDAFGDNLKNTAQEAGYADDEQSIEVKIASMVQAVLSIVGVLFLILTIYGGFMYMLSQGDPGKTKTAIDIIKAAIIGLIIIASAYAVSIFVVVKFGGSALS